MTDKPQPSPKGIGAILIGPDGTVFAHAFDFDCSTMGGCETWEGQLYRAKRACVWKFIKEFTYGDLSKVIEDYAAEEMVRKLCREHKYRMRIINIGHDVEERELNR